ncbi:Kinase, NEK [Giardia muris]|uniref:Kinase, NEK n=1 Tax=Giardia muris TaxID=5742 RepID=A0A4Z1SLM3_GIAMU|nr:Kinase, NEK [Giardia muris]|eukprot:TNJ26430.1 Kinase, NEK [Giardia muris]
MSITGLMRAARYDDLEGVKRNLNQIGKQDEDGRTALMYAAINGHSDCIPLLKEELGMQNKRGWTALMYAAHNGYTDCIPLLKEEFKVQDNDGKTALMEAAMSGRANCIPLLEKEIGMQDNDGSTALMWAAFNGKTDCARLLLCEAGKKSTEEWYDFPNTYPPGMTALMMAAHENYPDIVELLLPYEQGLRDFEGHTAKWYAKNSSWRGDFTKVRKFLENEGLERLPPNPELLRLRRRINDLTTENDSLKKDLSSSKNTLEETRKELSQLNREVSSLKQQLQKANEEAKKNHELNEALNKRAQEAGKSLAEAREENTSLKGQLTEMESTTLKQDDKISHLRTENTSLQEQLSSSKKAQGEAEERLSQMNQEISSLKAQLSKTSEEKDALHKQFEDRERRDNTRIKELTNENDSLKNAHEETKNELSQSNRENSSLKQQLDNAIEESKRHAKMNEDLRKASNQNRALINALTTEKGTLQEQLSKTTEDLKRALADQKAQNLALEKENARLRTEGHDMKDLRRRLEEVEEEKRILLQNLAAVGGRLPPAREDSSLISSAIQGDLNALRRHLDQAGQKDSSGMTALMHAASRGQTEVVRLLRPLEARLQDGRGWTALMHAVGEGHEECVSLLLLERDMKDGEGRTAAEHAEGEKMRRVLMHQPTLPRLPDSLSEYHLTAVLGEGMFGTVYAGHGNGRNVAVKVVSLGRYGEEGREKLRKEARMHLSLNHPNIIRCLGIGENDLDNTFVLVTELCYGDLSEEMNRRKNAGHSYTDQEVWKTIREVAAALAYLHEKRLVHRDLKPANILIASDDRCVLGDFGLIKMLGDSSRMDTILGTLSYMAPEIHREERYDKSVDVWALGVIGYEMCTHALPFRNIVAITEETPAPSLEGRPSDLAALISRMLSKDPKDRPTAREVLEEAERHQ